MQSNNRDIASIWDMIRAIENINSDVEGFSLEMFLSDGKTLRSVERSLEILGEAARRVSPEFQQANPTIDWHNTIRLRNVIAHRYDQVSHEQLWLIVVDVLPELVAILKLLLTDD
jgi:uncharacterized protein with HEPN domain